MKCQTFKFISIGIFVSSYLLSGVTLNPLLADESIRATSYYPSPFGNYKELDAQDDTTLATSTGNVGVGTLTPVSKLDVGGSLRILAGTSSAESAGALYLVPALNGSGLGFNLYNDSGWFKRGDGINNAAALIQQNIANGMLNLYTWPTTSGNTEAVTLPAASLVLTGAGAVGIGTYSPLTQLDVRGTVATGLLTNKQMGANLLPFGNTANGRRVGLGNNIFFNGSNWIARGDTTANNGAAAILTKINDGNLSFCMVSSTSGSNQTIPNGSLGGTTQVLIDSNGNVGIGTSQPQYKLEVIGGPIQSNGRRSFMFGEDADGWFWFMSGPDEGGNPITNQDGDNVIGWLGPNASPTMATRQIKIMGDTYVGYSTVGFHKDLMVWGNIEAQGPKSFDIPHPAKPGYRLSHSAVESPTRGDTLYRFETTIQENGGESSIMLPSYFKYLNEKPQIWVSAVDRTALAYGVIDASNSKILVRGEKKGRYDVLVLGTRKDPGAKEGFDKLGVEYQERGEL